MRTSVDPVSKDIGSIQYVIVFTENDPDSVRFRNLTLTVIVTLVSTVQQVTIYRASTYISQEYIEKSERRRSLTGIAQF